MWCPYKKKHVEQIEQVQRHYTKRVIGTKNMKYHERLAFLKLPSLEYRRIRGDLLETYKVLNNLYDPLTTGSLFTHQSINSITRSHSFKLYKSRVNLKLTRTSSLTELSTYGTASLTIWSIQSH